KWIAVTGRSRAGKLVGVNLVDPTPDAPHSENAVWLDGKRHPLARVTIGDGSARADGLELAWTPRAEIVQSLDLPLLRHRLVHAGSAFSGRVIGEDLAGIVGVAEDNDTWW